jgi:hypothetical protein
MPDGKRARWIEELAEIAQQIIERGVDYEKLAEEEAARTDPWRWYCRECGATGEDPDEGGRDWEAGEHLRTTPCGRREIVGMDWFGRTLHVWTYSKSAVARWN